MPIRVFPPHYQLVYINFDISSFSLISYTYKSWLIRVADRESRRMEKRLEYLYRLRKKAVKRFGEESEQVVRIDKWLMEVRRYMLEFSRVSTYADKLGTGI